MTLEELHKEHSRLQDNNEIISENMNTIINESNRVADVAHNAGKILDNLDSEFEKQTGLKGKDVAFLIIATALQMARAFIINKITEIEKAGEGNLEKNLKKEQKNILERFDNGEIIKSIPYKASLTQIISTPGVPYDCQEMIDSNMRLFKGANHRFSTLGHDPILGLVFGTANILTNTITCVNLPFITTNHVYYTDNFKHPVIGGFCLTSKMLSKSIDRFDGDIESVVAATIKQIIHIGTDMYTPCGIALPFLDVILDKKHTAEITKYINTGGILKVCSQASFAILINTIISTLHYFLFNPKKDGDKYLYSIRTRKVILYSNLIASASNVLWVGTNMAIGRKQAIHDLDLGGLIVTIKKLITDPKYFRKIKEEFITNNFNSLIQGNELVIRDIN